MEKMKTVVILPGTYAQVPLIEKSKSMGNRTLVINPYDNSPAFPFADGYFQRDIFDFDNVLAYCVDQHADAVISDECDIAMPLIARLGEALGVPTLDSGSAELFTNKFAMREFCLKHGIPSPEYEFCDSVEQVEQFFDRMQSPIIIKPIDSNCSKGVFKISARTDIRQFFSETMTFGKTRKGVLAERFIDGTEFTVDGIKTPNKHYTLAISEKKHFKHNINVACELYFTHVNDRFDYSVLAAQNNKFVENSPLKYGLTHAEYKYENGKFYLIEIAARGGGGHISSHIVPYISGVDNYKYLLECYLGNVSDPDFSVQDKYKNRCAVLKFFDTPDDGGKVERVEGIELLEADPRISIFRFNFEAGDVIKHAENDAERIGFYIACCESKEELDGLMQRIQETVKIICYKENNRMDIKEEIIDYIKTNRVSTTEVADCMGKSGVLNDILPINARHFVVGEIQYLYAIDDSNWTVHEDLDRNPQSGKVILIDAIDVHGRAVIGDIVSKYILLYLGNKAIVCTGKMRDAHDLVKENYPIWCAGVSPVGCFNKPVDKTQLLDEIERRRNLFEGAIAVCDDSGVVIIPRELHTEEFLQKLHAIEAQEDMWYDCIDRRKWSTYRTICLKEYLNKD